VADLLATYETSRDSWHAAAIAGHSNFSKLFPLSVGEMIVLKDKNIYTVSQLLEVNDLTGRLTDDENRLLLADFSTYRTFSRSCAYLFAPCGEPLLLTSLSPKPQPPPPSSAWTKTSVKFSNNSRDTNYTS
jgi:hypothetical protein